MASVFGKEARTAPTKESVYRLASRVNEMAGKILGKMDIFEVREMQKTARSISNQLPSIDPNSPDIAIFGKKLKAYEEDLKKGMPAFGYKAKPDFKKQALLVEMEHLDNDHRFKDF